MDNKKWVAIWGNSPTYIGRGIAQYAKDVTIRVKVKAAFDFEKSRFHFSNFSGNEPVTISKACVAASTEGNNVNAESNVAITFNKNRNVVIPAGGEVVSDEVDFSADKGEDFCVSYYLGEFTLISGGEYTMGPLTHECYAIGDMAESAELPIEITNGCSTPLFLNTIDGYCSSDKKAMVLFGDSITSQNWAEYLALRALDEFPNRSCIRKSKSGSRVLREYSCLPYIGYGQKGAKRFISECSVAGADSVLILHGINDIIHPDGVNPFRPMCDLPTVDELIDGFRYYIKCARKMGLKVYVGTNLPIKGWRTYAPFREELRIGLNEWIRTTDEIDGVVDFDAALRDPDDISAMLSEYDSGDHLHPSYEGGKRMAYCVPSEFLK